MIDLFFYRSSIFNFITTDTEDCHECPEYDGNYTKGE